MRWEEMVIISFTLSKNDRGHILQLMTSHPFEADIINIQRKR